MRHHLLQIAAAGALAAFSTAPACADFAPGVTIVAAATGQDDHHGHDGHDGPEAIVAGALEISSPWVRAMLPGQPAGGGYLTVINTGDEADRLVAASSPAAGRVEIHTMEVVDDVMVMRPVEGGLEIPAGGTVELKPGGLHLMFMEVAAPFADGDTVDVQLEFEKAGSVDATFAVRTAHGGDGHDHDHDH